TRNRVVRPQNRGLHILGNGFKLHEISRSSTKEKVDIDRCHWCTVERRRGVTDHHGLKAVPIEKLCKHRQDRSSIHHPILLHRRQPPLRQRMLQHVDSLPRRARYFEKRQPALLGHPPQRRHALSILRRIHLCRHYHHRLLDQRVAEARQLAHH